MSERNVSWKAKIRAQGGERLAAFRAAEAVLRQRQRAAKAKREGKPYADMIDRVLVERHGTQDTYVPVVHRRVSP